VFYEDDHERGWGQIVLINRTDKPKAVPCCDYAGDIITIRKDGCNSEIETTPSCVYQLAPYYTFRGNVCVFEHNEDIDYPLYCPDEDENCYFFETDVPLLDGWKEHAQSLVDAWFPNVSAETRADFIVGYWQNLASDEENMENFKLCIADRHL
jgi:hypothetical protein